MKKVVIFFICYLIINSCVSPISKSDDYKKIAESHKIVAILPTNAILEIKNVTDVNKIREQEKIESKSFQKNIFNWLEKRKKLNLVEINIQDVEETNRILKENGIESVIGKSYKEIANILNVDAVMVSKVTMAKPLTNSEAFFSSLATGFVFDSKVNSGDISIYDKNSSKVFWNLNHIFTGTFSSNEKLTNDFLRIVVRSFPYNKQKLK